jgi:hypothetical protein
MSSATHLREAPHEATAALEAALQGCPRPTFFGEYNFATYSQKEEIYGHLNSDFLTELEYKWVLWKIVEFNTDVAAEVSRQLVRIIDYRRAIGPLPAPAGRYYPEQYPKSGNPGKSQP